MKTVKIDSNKPYEMIIGSSILGFIGMLSPDKIGRGKAVIVTDDIVDALYSDIVEKSLSSAGYTVIKYVVENGEHSKNIDSYVKLLNFMSDNHVTRSDAVFALGGGVIADLAGFTAATYLRGIKLILVPTTLMAIDSAVGGKTSLNLRTGKNLVGAYSPPDFVYFDYSVLNTLPPSVFADGMAEIIKDAVCCDRELFDRLRDPVMPQIEQIIIRSVEIKHNVVRVDEYDKNDRQILNFGHTVGHAIEKCSNYGVTHGSAIAVGMTVITRAAVKKGICSPDCLKQLKEILESNGLPTQTSFTPDELYAVILSDKKRSGETITLSVPAEMGRCELRTVTVGEAKEYLTLGLEENA